jgi:hypothetical protein
MASKERAGFDTVQAGASRAVGASPEWALSAGEIEALDRRVQVVSRKWWKFSSGVLRGV